MILVFSKVIPNNFLYTLQEHNKPISHFKIKNIINQIIVSKFYQTEQTGEVCIKILGIENNNNKQTRNFLNQYSKVGAMG